MSCPSGTSAAGRRLYGPLLPGSPLRRTTGETGLGTAGPPEQQQQHSSEDEGDLTIEVEEEEYHPIVTDDFSILDMFIIKPESVKIKNRNNKKKNKKKKWFRSKKQRKPNGKMHYIIL